MVQLTAQVFPFVAVCTLGDGINAVAAGDGIQIKILGAQAVSSFTWLSLWKSL